MVNCEICKSTRATFGYERRKARWCSKCKKDDAENVFRMKPTPRQVPVVVTEDDTPNESVEAVETEVKVDEDTPSETVETEAVESVEDTPSETVETEEVADEEVAKDLVAEAVEDTDTLEPADEESTVEEVADEEVADEGTEDPVVEEVNDAANSDVLKSFEDSVSNLYSVSNNVNRVTEKLNSRINRVADELETRLSGVSNNLNNKIEEVLSKLSDKLDQLKETEDKVNTEIQSLDDLKHRNKEYNSRTHFINILMTAKNVWHVASNQPDSKVVSMIKTEILSCDPNFTRTVPPVLNKYKFALVQKRILPFKEYMEKIGEKHKSLRDAVYDMVFMREV